MLIEDLNDPVLTAGQRAAIDFAAGLDLSLAEERVRAEALDRAGATAFPVDDEFDRRLGVWLSAVEADEDLNPLGRLIHHGEIVRLLTNRLRLAALLDRHPEIRDIELEPPLIVIGLPRSGTTHLVNLIAADDRFRSLPFWESQEPVPAAGEGPGADGVDPRWSRCQANWDAQRDMVPVLAAMHPRAPAVIEEEVELLEIDLASYKLEWTARVPGWRDDYFATDHTADYRRLIEMLQVLTWFRGPRRWVLKSPQHLEQIGPLTAAFPDATIAVTHRDPLAVVQSAVTMMAYGARTSRSTIDAPALADYWVDRIERLLRASIEDRDRLPAQRTVDVVFDEFMADEVGTVAGLYDAAGLSFDDRARQRVAGYSDANPRDKGGRVTYDFRGHFDRDPSEIRDRFAFYLDRFPVRPEVD